MNVVNSVKRGDIYYADLSPVVGSEQGGLRPVLIIQNDIGNRYSPTVIAAAITSKMSKAHLPTHIDIYAEKAGLAKDSVILTEQVRTLDKRRLKEKMGHLDDYAMEQVNMALSVSFGLNEPARDAADRAALQENHTKFAASLSEEQTAFGTVHRPSAVAVVNPPVTGSVAGHPKTSGAVVPPASADYTAPSPVPQKVLTPERDTASIPPAVSAEFSPLGGETV